MINEFKKFSEVNPKYDLLIFGDGEEKNKLKNIIKKLELENKVHLMGFTEDIYFYMRNSCAFILSSLWEDPGFVIIEAAMCNTLVISSNCKNGPEEFLMNGEAGFLYEKNEKNALKKCIIASLENTATLDKMKILAKKNCLKYTFFRHHKMFTKILTQ